MTQCYSDILHIQGEFNELIKLSSSVFQLFESLKMITYINIHNKNK